MLIACIFVHVFFSYVGAHQLGLDVAFMKSWLRQCIPNEAVRLTILDLGILKALNGAVQLLKRQNGKRSSSRFRDSFREDSKYHNDSKNWDT